MKSIIFQASRGGPTFSRGGGGSNFFQVGGGVGGGGGGSKCLFPIKTHITCDFSGGVQMPYPPLWIRTWHFLLECPAYKIIGVDFILKLEKAAINGCTCIYVLISVGHGLPLI